MSTMQCFHAIYALLCSNQDKYVGPRWSHLLSLLVFEIYLHFVFYTHLTIQHHPRGSHLLIPSAHWSTSSHFSLLLGFLASSNHNPTPSFYKITILQAHHWWDHVTSIFLCLTWPGSTCVLARQNVTLVLTSHSVYMPYTPCFFIYLSVDGHLGCFHFLTVMNNAS